MKRTFVAAAVAVVAVFALASCRAKDDPARQLSGSAGVDSSAMGSYYGGPQPWEKDARKAYDVPQPTGSNTPAAK